MSNKSGSQPVTIPATNDNSKVRSMANNYANLTATTTSSATPKGNQPVRTSPATLAAKKKFSFFTRSNDSLPMGKDATSSSVRGSKSEVLSTSAPITYPPEESPNSSQSSFVIENLSSSSTFTTLKASSSFEEAENITIALDSQRLNENGNHSNRSSGNSNEGFPSKSLVKSPNGWAISRSPGNDRRSNTVTLSGSPQLIDPNSFPANKRESWSATTGGINIGGKRDSRRSSRNLDPHSPSSSPRFGSPASIAIIELRVLFNVSGFKDLVLKQHHMETSIVDVVRSYLVPFGVGPDNFGLFLPTVTNNSDSSSNNNNGNSIGPATTLGGYWLDLNKKLNDYDEKFLKENTFELRYKGDKDPELKVVPASPNTARRSTNSPPGNIRRTVSFLTGKKFRNNKAPTPKQFFRDPNARVTVNKDIQGNKADPHRQTIDIRFEYVQFSPWANPDIAGEVVKQGSYVKSNWNPRWLILQNSKLFYFKSQPHKDDDEPAGTFLISDMTKVEENEQSSSKPPKILGFTIENVLQQVPAKKVDDKTLSINGKNYVYATLNFGTRTKQDLEDWINAIKSSSPASNDNSMSSLEAFPNNGQVKMENIQVSFSAETGYVGLSPEWKSILSSCGITERFFYEHTEEVIELLKFHYNSPETSTPIVIHSPPMKSKETIDDVVNKDIHPDSLYESFQLVGSGTFGEVYLATNVRSKQMVAIKKMLLTPKREPLFISEISVQRSTEHPNVVKLFDAYKVGDYIWVALEYMANGNLYQVLSEFENVKMSFTEPQIAYVISETLKGLSFLHGMHKIHRDIKSDNILIGANAEIKIADFGYAVQLSDEEEKRSTICGSPYWMAPEVILGDKYGKEVDIWSLGIMLMECCDLQPPYILEAPAKALVLITTKPVPGLKTYDKWSKDLLHFLSLCLQRDPALRPQSIELLQHPFLSCTCTASEFKDAILIKRNKKSVKPCLIQ